MIKQIMNMTIEEKRRKVLEKRINFLKDDVNEIISKEVEYKNYGRANYFNGKLGGVEGCDPYSSYYVDYLSEFISKFNAKEVE